MTVPPPPDSAGRAQPPVPDTFLRRAPGSFADGEDWGAMLGALSGPLAVPMNRPRPPGARGARSRPRHRRSTPPVAPAGVELPPLPGHAPAVRTGTPARPAAPGPSAPTGREPGRGRPRDAETQPGGGRDAPGASGAARPAPRLPADVRRRLLAGEHDDPHSVLGARVVGGGAVRFRALHPGATSVTVVWPGEQGRDELRFRLRDEEDGFFAGDVAVPGGLPGRYELLVAHGVEGRRREVRVTDPYQFPPALSEPEARLLAAGRHGQPWRALGARTMRHRGVPGTRFTLWAPGARGVRLTGDPESRYGGTAAMRSLGPGGVWELFVPGVAEGAVYGFETVLANGTRVSGPDPMGRAAQLPPRGRSVVYTSGYRWRDGDWLVRRGARDVQAAPLSLYELHLSSWRPGLTYRELAQQLPLYVRDLGFTHVKFPVGSAVPPTGARDGEAADGLAPDPRLGGPDGLKQLVDALHRAGVGVLLAWRPQQCPGAVTGAEGSAAARSLLVGGALYWCEEFHFDGLCVDLAALCGPEDGRAGGGATGEGHGGGLRPGAVRQAQELNAALHRRCPGVVTVAEVSAPGDGLTRATHHAGESGRGGLGFDFAWNARWVRDARTFADRAPGGRAYRAGELTSPMVSGYAENHLLPLSCPGPAGGEAASPPEPDGQPQETADHRAFLAFTWAHPGKQQLCMGQEFAPARECSPVHGPDWWLLDPASPAARAHRGVRDLVRDLNEEYQRAPALWQLDGQPAGFSWVHDGTGGAESENVFAFLRFDAEGGALLAVCNFAPVPRPAFRLGVPAAGTRWQAVLDTDDERYGGVRCGARVPVTAEDQPAHGLPASVTLALPPLSALWLRPVDEPAARSGTAR